MLGGEFDSWSGLTKDLKVVLHVSLFSAQQLKSRITGNPERKEVPSPNGNVREYCCVLKLSLL